MDRARHDGVNAILVDLDGVLSLGGVVVRIERAYSECLRGSIRKFVDGILAAWNIGLSLDVGGFAIELRTNPQINVEAVLLRLLDLPRELYERKQIRSLIAFDEFQDLLAVERADGVMRSVIQHQGEAASYVYSGSTPSMMSALFDKPSAPLLEQAVMLKLNPLPGDETANYISERFERTGKDSGTVLGTLVRFCRGHPQRTILLAHMLWEATKQGGLADEQTWMQAQADALDYADLALRAIMSAYTNNERRMLQLLALAPGRPNDDLARMRVGLAKGSVHKALSSLVGRGAVTDEHTAQLIDPLFELWLRERAPAP